MTADQKGACEWTHCPTRVGNVCCKENADPKTTLERQKAFRQRQQEAGLKEIRNLWAAPEHHPPIKAYAAKLAKQKDKK